MSKGAEGHVIHLINGACWGVAPDGRTIYIGTETEVQALLEDPTKTTSNQTINQIIVLERRLKDKEKQPAQRDYKKEVRKLAASLGFKPFKKKPRGKKKSTPRGRIQ